MKLMIMKISRQIQASISCKQPLVYNKEYNKLLQKWISPQQKINCFEQKVLAIFDQFIEFYPQEEEYCRLFSLTTRRVSLVCDFYLPCLFSQGVNNLYLTSGSLLATKFYPYWLRDLTVKTQTMFPSLQILSVNKQIFRHINYSNYFIVWFISSRLQHLA